MPLLHTKHIVFLNDEFNLRSCNFSEEKINIYIKMLRVVSLRPVKAAWLFMPLAMQHIIGFNTFLRQTTSNNEPAAKGRKHLFRA
jgi:hypothetical protein